MSSQSQPPSARSGAQTPKVNLPSVPLQALNKQLHPNAAKLAKEYASAFAETLILYAKAMAYEREDDIVLSNHIRESLNMIRKEPEKGRLKQYVIFISSTILGVSGQGFIAEILKFGATPPSGNFVAAIVYGIVTIISVVVATIAIVR